MKRYSAVKIRIHKNEWDNADLLTFLYANKFVQESIEGNESGDGVFWYDTEKEPLNIDLFKFAHCFDWIVNKSGSGGNSKLWYNNEPVTYLNYRTAIYSEEEEAQVNYTYIPFDKITDIAPIVESEI